MEAEIHAESQMPRGPRACLPGFKQAKDVPDLGGAPLLPALPHPTMDLGVKRVPGPAESRELRPAPFTFTKALEGDTVPSTEPFIQAGC